ncbi:MAG: aquaporin [Patescibacteria group bacterium]
MLEKDLWKKLVAEFVGGFILTSAIVFPSIALHDAGIGAFLFIMFTAGLGMAMVVWLFRDISGGHANPVITFAMMLMRKVSVVTGVFYWIAQLAGAVVATYYAAGMFKIGSLTTADLSGYGVAMPVTGYKDIQASLAEAFGVFILVSAVLAVIHIKDKVQAGLVIGSALLIAVVMTVAVSGGALNPAREFGPMLLTKSIYKDTFLWIYLVAPMVGALVAVLVHMIINEKISLLITLPKARTLEHQSSDDAK